MVSGGWNKQKNAIVLHLEVFFREHKGQKCQEKKYVRKSQVGKKSPKKVREDNYEMLEESHLGQESQEG